MTKPPTWVDYHPVYLDLRGRQVVIVGGGSIALEKLNSLLPLSQAAITVVSPEACKEIQAWNREGRLTWQARPFEDTDIDGAYMVIAATDDPELNARVYSLGNAANRLSNSVDDPANCNFIMAAIGRRGPMQVAVSSAGCSPALAQRVRRRVLDEILTEEVGDLAAFLGERRPEVKDRLPGYRVRQAFWERVIGSEIPDELAAGNHEAASSRFEDMLDRAVAAAPGDFDPPKGKVYLAGAGPGDPDLITVKALRALQRADVILYDRLVDPRLLNHAHTKAERIYVGKEPHFDVASSGGDTSPLNQQSQALSSRDKAEGSRPAGGSSLAIGGHRLKATASNLPTFNSTNRQTSPQATRQQQIHNLMIEHAAKGKTVVRLKGGDPFVFGRGGEEMLALHAAGIEFEVIPGVTSAIAAPSAAGIPVTHRGVSTSFAVFAGHEAEGRDDVPWDAAARIPTAVFLMGVERLPTIVANLIQAGRAPDTPVAIVSNATLPTQQSVTATLGDIVEKAQNIPSPAVIVVGDVVAFSTLAGVAAPVATAVPQTA